MNGTTHREVSRAVDKEFGETVALKKMGITLPGEANQKEGVRATCRRNTDGCGCGSSVVWP